MMYLCSHSTEYISEYIMPCMVIGSVGSQKNYPLEAAAYRPARDEVSISPAERKVAHK